MVPVMWGLRWQQCKVCGGSSAVTEVPAIQDPGMNLLQPCLMVQPMDWWCWVSSQPWTQGTCTTPGTICFCPAQSLEQPGAELHPDVSPVPNSKKSIAYLHRGGMGLLPSPAPCYLAMK